MLKKIVIFVIKMPKEMSSKKQKPKTIQIMYAINAIAIIVFVLAILYYILIKN